MCAILIKDGCVVTLKGKKNKLEGINDEVLVEKDKLAIVNIYLSLDKVLLFNVFEEITSKGLCDKLHNLY